MTKEYPWGKGTPKYTRDSTDNDSDKSFTVPTGKVWELKFVEAVIGTSATVGNRAVQLSISNGTAYVHMAAPSGSVAASNSGAFLWTTDIALVGNATQRYKITDTNIATVGLTDYIPTMILPAGYIINVKDKAAVDAAADDMTVVLHYVEYDA